MNKDKVYVPSDEEFKMIVESSSSICEIGRKLGFIHSPGKSSKRRIKERISLLNLKTTSIDKNRDLTKEEISEAIKKTYGMAAAARYLNSSIKTFKRFAIKYNLWIPNQSKEGTNTKVTSPKLYEKNKELFISKLCENSKMKTSHVHSCLIKYGLKELKCEKCGGTTWNGQNIPLDVHHKDGDNTNNSIENLELLCPNCHRQTDNFGSKNKRK